MLLGKQSQRSKSTNRLSPPLFGVLPKLSQNKNMDTFRTLLISYILLATLPLAAQQSTATTDTIPFKLTAHNNLSIEAILNDTDTLNFMLHTAANSMTVISDAAERLSSISWTNETDVNSWGGSTKARFSKSNSLRIGQITWDSIPIWETKNSGPMTEGKFGPNLFAGKVIDINFDHQVIIVRDKLPNNMDEYQKLPLLFQDGSMFIEGISKIGGEDYSNLFLLHSGYGGAILYDDAFVEKSKIGAQVEIVGQKTLKDSYGNTLVTKQGKLPEFKMGQTVLTDLPVGFFEGAIGRQKMSVLGGDILKRYNIILDSNRDFIYLKPNTAFGMEYTTFK